MTTKSVLQAFENYEKARLAFSQTIADVSGRRMYSECLLKWNVLELLVPLLSDSVVKVQQSAALAIGRLANNSAEAATRLLQLQIMPILLANIDKRTKYYKKSGMLAVRGMARHSPELASALVTDGVLDALLLCLEDFDTGVKESAAWAIGYIASHNHALALACASSGAVPLLKLCLQEPELCLKQIAASALSDISKHSAELAQALVDSNCVPYLVKSLGSPDPRLKKHVLCCLSHLAKHSLELAEVVVEAEVFPDALLHMSHPDEGVRRAAATVTKEVVKHHIQMAQLVVNSGGLTALVRMVSSSEGNTRLPAVVALGYVAAQSDQLALTVIASKAVEELQRALVSEKEDHVKAALVWTLGQIGKHSPGHSKALAQAHVFPELVALYANPDSSNDLKQKARAACKLVLTKCMHLPALEPLVRNSPPELLKYILGQFSKLLPKDPAARRLFVSTGSLKKIQEVHAEPGTPLHDYVTIINLCFPEEIIRYYSPGYPETLLQQVEQFTPQIKPLLGKESSVDADDVELMLSLNEPPRADWDVC